MDNNQSKWQVVGNPIWVDGSLKIRYAVGRIKDKNQVLHSGNMEYATGYMESQEEAQKIADRLNNGESDGK